jgi:hypothetical protein
MGAASGAVAAVSQLEDHASDLRRPAATIADR